VGVLFVVGLTVVWFYDSGAKGVKIFEGLLKAMVGVVVISFFLVVLKMSLSPGGLPWSEIFAGFIPDPNMLLAPAEGFREPLAATGKFSSFWHDHIMKDQRDVMITAAATAVGINMTFLLPYSMLKRGWDKDFRGLAIFDLSTGLFIPFVLATSCVVLAAATQFHLKPDPGLIGVKEAKDPGPGARTAFTGLLDRRVKQEQGEAAYGKMSDEEKAAARENLPEADKKIAAMLIRRDAFDLAKSLGPLTGEGVAQYVFGIGVVGMAISTIIILMLINGFVICEMLGRPSSGTTHRLGCFLAGAVGAAGPFIWGSKEAQFWLAVPTSVFGFVLLPIAYSTFFLMMNSKSLLGENRPKGAKRLLWNTLMGIAVSLALLGSGWTIWNTSEQKLGSGVYGLTGLAAFALIVFLGRRRPKTA
jgi:Natural resistance-associated macrophage protein-like